MPSSNTLHNAGRRLRTLFAASAAVGTLALGAVPGQAAAAQCAGANTLPGHASSQTLAHTTLCLINAERTKRGLRGLRLDARLSRAAAGHSLDMVTRHYFSHTAPSGATFVDRIRSAGYLRSAHSWTIGENIDFGTQSYSSPAGALSAWMHSPPHRANILRPSFRQIGIGIAFGAPRDLAGPAATYTTDFGATGITHR